MYCASGLFNASGATSVRGSIKVMKSILYDFFPQQIGSFWRYSHSYTVAQLNTRREINDYIRYQIYSCVAIRNLDTN